MPVPDTRAALQMLAREVRRRWGRPLVAVTGSAGKSTTKEMIAAILRRRFNVMRSPGNLNNDFGVPLALLALEPVHDVAVMELGMSSAGEIAWLASLAEPEVGVVTNVGAAHLQFFRSVDEIALAKRELVDYLTTRGAGATAVLNQDDERVRQFSVEFPGRVLTFGFSPQAAFRAADVRPGLAIGSAFRLVSPDWEADFTLPLPGSYNVLNALAAVAAASSWEIPPGEIKLALAEFHNLHQRSEILSLPGQITVINDSYNSNPLAMARMLEAIAVWPRVRRRIVVAGEMLELGAMSPGLHRGVGQECAQRSIDWLIAVRGDARYFLDGAEAGGIPRSHLVFFADAKPAGEFCKSLISPGDVILVKGSRAVHLEKVIELLTKQQVEVRKLT